MIKEELTNAQLDNFCKELEKIKTMTRQLQKKHAKLLEYKSYNDKEEEKINCKMNPEDYYSFKMFDKGCSIVYTNYKYDTTLEKFVRGGEFHYSIKYYYCRSRVFEDKRMKLKYCYENTSYGDFDKLENAIYYFYIAVADIISQFTNYNGLDPLAFDFYNLY